MAPSKENFQNPPFDKQESVAEPRGQGPGAKAEDEFDRIRESLRTRLGSEPDVLSVTRGYTPVGDETLLVLLKHGDSQGKLPKSFQGYPVESEIIGGDFEAY